ncbi:MAG: hypothetical protein V4564_18250 [Pseudomonadota bacterium]
MSQIVVKVRAANRLNRARPVSPESRPVSVPPPVNSPVPHLLSINRPSSLKPLIHNPKPPTKIRHNRSGKMTAQKQVIASASSPDSPPRQERPTQLKPIHTGSTQTGNDVMNKGMIAAAIFGLAGLLLVLTQPLKSYGDAIKPGLGDLMNGGIGMILIILAAVIAVIARKRMG